MVNRTLYGVVRVTVVESVYSNSRWPPGSSSVDLDVIRRSRTCGPAVRWSSSFLQPMMLQPTRPRESSLVKNGVQRDGRLGDGMGWMGSEGGVSVDGD
jgi:hypothetical protein